MSCSSVTSACRVSAPTRAGPQRRNAARAVPLTVAKAQSDAASAIPGGKGAASGESLIASRRAALRGAAGTAVLALMPALAWADEQLAVVEAVAPAAPALSLSMTEPMLAYNFQYPSEDMNGVALKWFTSRQPERYSSAAPMSADARQRIVFELVDFSEPLIMTVSVGPVPPGLDGEPSSWSAEEVADAVLKDKSTGRVTNGQRVALSSVEEARTETRGGVAYYVYEHVSQGSPNMNEVLQKETYRHSYAVTACRDGYLYTLNLAAPERRWASMEPLYKAAQDTFTLAATGKDFVPPDKDPWRFW